MNTIQSTMDYVCDEASRRGFSEPVGMSSAELFRWYLDLPHHIRKQHLTRIAELGSGLLSKSCEKFIDEFGTGSVDYVPLESIAALYSDTIRKREDY